MIKTLLLGFLVCSFSMSAIAQTKAPTKKRGQHKTVVSKTKNQDNKGEAHTLVNTGTYKSFAPASNTVLRIADPTINQFNLLAAGASRPLKVSGIAGMSKSSNGFANGHVLLRTTTATSSGTGYGSAAVGTGTSLQGVCTGESAIGVNGKSPYAGPWLWGDKQPVYPGQSSDSTRRQ